MERGRLLEEEGEGGSAIMSFSLRGRESGSIVSIFQLEQNISSTTPMRTALRARPESEISSKDRFLVMSSLRVFPSRESTPMASAGGQLSGWICSGRTTTFLSLKYGVPMSCLAAGFGISLTLSFIAFLNTKARVVANVCIRFSPPCTVKPFCSDFFPPPAAARLSATLLSS